VTRIAALALAALAAGAATPALAAGPTAAKPAAATAVAAKPRLVFFMNPYGAPCQMQDRILQEMSGELRAKVDVVYLRTTSQADLAWFQQYGIRSLPTLLLADASGKEIRRATPGIQSADQVRKLVGP
jgi:thioredoxin